MATSSKPVILIVHGSWHNPNHFFRFRLALHEAGFETECPTQPSYGVLKLSNPLAADAYCIRSAAQALVDQGRDVIVVMHSYGGIIGSEAINEDLGQTQRAKQGLKGGVVHLLYLCAFIVPVGKSLGDALLGKNELPPFIPTAEDGTCAMLKPAERFYNDLSGAEAAKWVSELRPQIAEAQLTPLSNAAYTYLPCTYLFCKEDQALPFFLQEKMVSDSGVPFAEEICSAGHSPFLSIPEKVVKVVNNVVERLSEKAKWELARE